MPFPAFSRGHMFSILQDLRVHVAQWFKSANLMIKKRLLPINIFFLRFQVYARAYVRIWSCMCVCMHLCMHVCMYVVCLSVCLSVCLYVCIYVCVYVCMCVCTVCVCTYRSVCVCLCVFVRIFLFVCLCLSVCLFKYISNIYIYILPHAQQFLWTICWSKSLLLEQEEKTWTKFKVSTKRRAGLVQSITIF